MTIEITKIAAKKLKRMNPALQERILNAIKGLTKEPAEGDIKPLRGEFAGSYRLRVGDYRVIYCYDERGAIVVLVVTDIGSRGDIYK